MLNQPANILGLDRHTLCELLRRAGPRIPITNQVSRNWLINIALEACLVPNVLEDGDFPIIVRPIGSQAGLGLAKLDNPAAVADYLEDRPEETFFISRFVDYSSDDGMFRKYRIVLVDGRAYACHMAISDQWKIWYLNADIILNDANRAEEARFMATFDAEFAVRHKDALAEMSRQIGLAYCTVDCAETKDGRLLIFEADNTAIVHDMDPVDVFPYKAPQMRKIFDAFVAMLYRHPRRTHAGKASRRRHQKSCAVCGACEHRPDPCHGRWRCCPLKWEEPVCGFGTVNRAVGKTNSAGHFCKRGSFLV